MLAFPITMLGATPAPATIYFAYSEQTPDTIQTYTFDGTDITTVGNPINLTTVGSCSLCALSSTRIAHLDSSADLLRVYDWDGTDWTLTGAGLSIPVANCSLTRLTADTVAFQQTSMLRVYQFNGSTWSQVGNTKTIAIGEGSIAALSATQVVVVNTTSALMTAYDWDGTDFTQVGSAYSFSGNPSLGITALNSTDIVVPEANPFCDLKVFRFNGSTFSQVGNTYALGGGEAFAAALSATQVVVNSLTIDALQVYDWDGTDFTTAGSSYTLAAANNIGMCSLNFYPF